MTLCLQVLLADFCYLWWRKISPFWSNEYSCRRKIKKSFCTIMAQRAAFKAKNHLQASHCTLDDFWIKKGEKDILASYSSITKSCEKYMGNFSRAQNAFMVWRFLTKILILALTEDFSKRIRSWLAGVNTKRLQLEKSSKLVKKS